ncbi:NAD-dependent epimerase/dehydratase family protein, partial [Sphingomonas sp. 10B4]|uniref:NAD-dependent epimerase/dehydratase family protein n=1 Tax=Sphingomonas sp. 10B4 TaxID=3048575 RepID=UPI003A598FD5
PRVFSSRHQRRNRPPVQSHWCARQIALIESGQQVPVLKVGNLEASRDFLDVQDVCSAYLAVLTLAGSRDYPRCMNIA